MKPHLSSVTLCCVDCTDKLHLAERAIEKSLEQCSFGDVKFLTHDPSRKYAIKIPRLTSLEAYSKFMVRDLARYVNTKYCLTIQSDGYVIHGPGWTDDFYNYDWIGAPWNPSGVIGNGGASWRSKKLLDACAALKTDDNEHPEDRWISVAHRKELEDSGIRVAPYKVAERFAFEGRTYDRAEWRSIPNKWNGQLCFHSHLSVLPPEKRPCNVLAHALDQGDLIYGCAAIKALGGGFLFISPDNRYPYPLNSRWARVGASPEVIENLKPLLMAQDYIWGCAFTPTLPFSTTHDLNKFREPWKEHSNKDWISILQLHMDAFNLPMPTGPWLTVPDPINVPGKPIVVNRTQRYHNYEFPWDRFTEKYADQILFVGSPMEASLFKGFCPNKKIEYYPTKDALELARVIAGGKRFVGNQSLALSIAHGLCKPVAVEEWPGNPNCHWVRPNAIYGFPKSWLA